MNNKVIQNFSKVKPIAFLIPIGILLLLWVYLYLNDGLSQEGYIRVQKEWFLKLNAWLSQFSDFQNNTTQMGDALVFLSILSVFVILTPRVWEALISGSLVSLVLSAVLKKIFSVPRPAAAIGEEHCVIIGKILKGHNSLPSGHSITAFTIIMVLLYAFMPSQRWLRWLWCVGMLVLGVVFVSSRVGVGAHYPLDTLVGACIGFISALSGIYICMKSRFLRWIEQKKFYPIFIIAFSGGLLALMNKITQEHLLIYYIAGVGLLVALYKMILNYVKK